MTIKATFAGLTLIIFSFQPTALSADDSSHQHKEGSISKVVDYSDLDLHSLGGQQQLKHRVSLAVIQLCETNTQSTIPLYELLSQKRCRKAAIRQAEPLITDAISKAQNSAKLATESGANVIGLMRR